MPVQFDMSAFERAASGIGLVQKEVPFAVANAMTRAAYTTKDALARDTWPKHVQVRNSNFMRASLDVEPALARDFREGSSMRAEIFDALGHVDLKRLTLGGVKKGKSGPNLAIPSKRVQRTGSGAIRRNQKPRSLKRTVRKGNLIFQAQGKGKSSKLQLMYAVRSSATIKPTVPFYDDFSRLYRGEFYKAFPNAVRNVLKRNRLSGR
jgi:hypothetical protein